MPAWKLDSVSLVNYLWPQGPAAPNRWYRLQKRSPTGSKVVATSWLISKKSGSLYFLKAEGTIVLSIFLLSDSFCFIWGGISLFSPWLGGGGGISLFSPWLLATVRECLLPGWKIFSSVRWVCGSLWSVKLVCVPCLGYGGCFFYGTLFFLVLFLPLVLLSLRSRFMSVWMPSVLFDHLKSCLSGSFMAGRLKV